MYHLHGSYFSLHYCSFLNNLNNPTFDVFSHSHHFSDLEGLSTPVSVQPQWLLLNDIRQTVPLKPECGGSTTVTGMLACGTIDWVQY